MTIEYWILNNSIWEKVEEPVFHDFSGRKFMCPKGCFGFIVAKELLNPYRYL